MARALVVGLTGGIAAGKSTVARWFAEWGAGVLDADAVGREVVRPGEPALAEIAREFGGEMLTAEGTLDRARLGEVVFASPAARATLNAITHPRIARELHRRIGALERVAAPPAVIIVEAALLFEAGWDREVDTTVAVVAGAEAQVARLRAARGMDEAAARARVAAQAPPESHRERAAHVIEADGTLAATREQAAAVWRQLLEAARRKREVGAPGEKI